MDSIADKLIETELQIDSEIVDPVHLEDSLAHMASQGDIQPEEREGLDRLLQDALTGKTFTLGFLRRVNARLANVYSEMHNAPVRTTASRSIAAVDDVVFARSTGEAGRVLAVIGTGSPSYQDTVKEYQKRYGWKQSVTAENALALYKVVHADGKEELYYDTETTADSSYVRLPQASSEAQAVLVDSGLLKEALNLWWNLLPENERALQFSRHGADLRILDRLHTRLAEEREDSLGETHPTLLTAYQHVKANGLAKRSKEASVWIKKADEASTCDKCGKVVPEGAPHSINDETGDYLCSECAKKFKGRASLKEKNARASVGWDVFLNGKKIDTVFYSENSDADYVKRSLINHDGYDSGISVRKSSSPKAASQVRIKKAEEKGTQEEDNQEIVDVTKEDVKLPSVGDAVEMVGDGKLPNFYWVTLSEDYYVMNKPGEMNWASDVYGFSPKGESDKVFASFDEAVDYVENVGLTEPDSEGMHTAMIEDRISGTLYQCGFNEYPRIRTHPGTRKEYTVPSYQYESFDESRYTKDKLGADFK